MMTTICSTPHHGCERFCLQLVSTAGKSATASDTGLVGIALEVQ